MRNKSIDNKLVSLYNIYMYNIIIIKEKNKTINYALNTHFFSFFFSLVELMMTHNIGFTSLLLLLLRLCFHLVFFFHFQIKYIKLQLLIHTYNICFLCVKHFLIINYQLSIMHIIIILSYYIILSHL